MTGAGVQESAFLCVQFTNLEVQELLLFVCLKPLIMSQDFTMLAGVTYRTEELSLKNLCAEQSSARKIHCKEMMKLFHSAVCLLNSLPVEYSSFIIFFPYMIFLSSHPTQVFGIFGRVLNV